MLRKGQQQSKDKIMSEKQMKSDTRVSFNKESGDTVSMNNVNDKCENGVEASNETAEAALTATMDEFRREGIVMLSKMEENG